MTQTTAPERPLILIVEDDPSIAEGLALNLKLQGYRTDAVGDGDAALARIDELQPNLVLLDITLPKRGGLEVLESLQRRGQRVPVIALSARQDEYDKVAALHLGADDYVTKPFALAELLARVAAVLRRCAVPARDEPPAPDDKLRFGSIAVDMGARTVTRAGAPVKLTHLEFELLVFLCRNAPRVFTRDEILREVWGSTGTLRTVDNFIAQLRSKLEDDPDEPKHLLTVRGSGYRLEPGE